MIVRRANLMLSALVALSMLGGLVGCARDPFACCDRRPSLADWFDMYGPTGCYCPDGSPRCSNGNCR